MRRKIKLTTRRELTTAVGQRYQAADRIAKKLILDEFTPCLDRAADDTARGDSNINGNSRGIALQRIAREALR
jgi:hypothetical protein